MASGMLASAFGHDAEALGDNSSAFGTGALAEGKRAVSIGSNSGANGYYGTAVGSNANADSEYSVALGGYATVHKNIDYENADYGIAIGYQTSASATNATALGKDASARAADAVAIGTSARAQKVNAIAIGNSSNAQYENSIAIGNSAKVFGGNNGIALGNNSSVAGRESLALGANSEIGQRAVNSVALGTNSKVEDDAINTVSVGNSKYTNADGTTGLYRRITNMAAGINDYDAVNVSQLKGGLDTLLGVTTAVDSTGKITGSNFAYNGVSTYSSVQSVFNQIGTDVAKIDTLGESVAGILNNGSYDPATGTVTGSWSVSTPSGGTIEFGGEAGGNITVSRTDTTDPASGTTTTTYTINTVDAPTFEAVTVGADNNKTTIDGGTITAANGTFSGTVSAGTSVTVGGTGGVVIDGSSLSIANGAANLTDSALTVGSMSYNETPDSLSFSTQTTITGVKAGAISAASTEAVNGSQLYNIGNNVANILGSGVTYDGSSNSFTSTGAFAGKNTVTEGFSALNDKINALGGSVAQLLKDNGGTGVYDDDSGKVTGTIPTSSTSGGTGAEDRITAVENKNTEQDNRIAEAENRITATDNKNTEQDYRLTNAENKNTEQDYRLTNAENKNTEQDYRLTNAENKNTEQDYRLTNHDKEFKTLQDVLGSGYSNPTFNSLRVGNVSFDGTNINMGGGESVNRIL